MVSDIQLIEKIKKNADSDSFNELLNRHSGIYTTIINRYSFHSAINKESLIEDKVFNIYQYALDFDPKREMKFGSYVGQRIKYACQNIVSKHVPITSIDAESSTTTNSFDSVNFFSYEDKSEANAKIEWENSEMSSKIFSILSSFKDKRVEKIFRLRHAPFQKKETPWWKIGKELNISTQTVINIYNKNIKILKHKIEKEV